MKRPIQDECSVHPRKNNFHFSQAIHLIEEYI